MTDEKLTGQTQTLEETKAQAKRNFRVLLINDEDHTYDYVVDVLTCVCGMKKVQAFQCAVEVDICGKTIVFYGSKDKCDQVARKITAYGPDHRLVHSMDGMKAIVESI